jgi:uracil-DNA glycosylase
VTAALVGQAPSRSSALPFEGRSGRRVEALAGLEPGELGATLTLVNVLDRWPGKNAYGKGDAFPRPRMVRERACRIMGALAEAEVDRVVFAGRLVAVTFGMPAGTPYLSWVAPAGGGDGDGAWAVPEWMLPHVWPSARFAVLPHPSGVNRWWNERANERRARRFLRELVS